MAFYKEQNTRIRLKRTATSGTTPTIGPSTNHTDGTWGIDDIYGGEFFWNMADEKLYLGWNTGSTSGVTLIYPSSGSGGTASGDYLPLSGGTVTGATQFTNGLTANTISATTYQNLPVSAITAGTNIVVSNTDGNVTISTNNLGTNVIWKDSALYSSNATANTLVTSKLIPANTFQVDDLFESIASFSSNTINGQSQIVRLYINTSSSLVGAQVLQTNTNTVGTGTYMGLYRHGFISATGSSGNLSILNTTLVTSTFSSSLAIGNTVTTQVTINTTVDQYLIWAIQMGSATYTVQIRGINVKLTR
jgi:hypothetical protein